MAFVTAAPDDAVALLPLLDTLADGKYAPHAAIARHEGKLRPGPLRVFEPLVNSGIDRQLGSGADRRCLRFDHDLAGAGGRNGVVLDLDLVRAGHNCARTIGERRSRSCHRAVYPPSTASTAPVIKDDASDARKRIGPTISSSLPQRLSGILSAMAW